MSTTSPGVAQPPTHRPNPLFRLAGAILVAVGVAVVVAGVLFMLAAIPHAAPTLGDLGGVARSRARSDLGTLFNGFAVVIVGMTVLTVGRYLWRGARRRGWRDRLGRLLIILGYLVVAVAMIFLVRAVPSALAGFNGDSGPLAKALLTCLVLALPGVGLATVGFRLAREKPLLKFAAKADL